MPPEQPATPPFKVRWHEVTWYSKLGAIIVFLGIVPALSFYIGMQYALTEQTLTREVVQQDTVLTPANTFAHEKRVAYFNTNLSDPTRGVLVIQTDIEGTDITGWKLRSDVSGKSYPIGEVNFKGTKYHVVLSAGGGAFFISKGSSSESYTAEGEYHLYLNAPDVIWGEMQDTIQLLDKNTSVVDTLNYTRSATIDEDSLVHLSPTQTITGTAVNTNVIKLYVCDTKSICKPDPSYGPNVPVEDGHWSTDIDGALRPGTYNLYIYDGDKNLLTQGALKVEE